MIQRIKIKDKEFIENYISFNLSHRRIICESCLRAFKFGNWAVKKSLGIEIIFQYIGMSEDTAMIYYALKEKLKKKSFFKALNDIFIKEDSQWRYTSEKVYKELDELEKININDFLRKLNLPSQNKTMELAGSDLIKEFGSPQKAKEQYKKEITNIFKNIQKIISNRFQTKQGKQLKLVRIYNKIKHGSIFVDDKTNQESIYFPINVKNLDRKGEEVIMEAYNLICNKEESLIKLVNQMKILEEDLRNLLRIFSRHNY